MDLKNRKTLSLPKWTDQMEFDRITVKSDTEKMEFVLKLAEENVKNHTGGPFAAAIFNMNNNEIISIGLNVVTSENTSIAHAEIMAIILAQSYKNHYRLDKGEYVLVSSAQPCAMCYGAIFWSGIKKLMYGASKKDVESICGFDEGPLPENWIQELGKRGIEVLENVAVESARKILYLYHETNGIIY